ncbi:hypothetical protein F4553_005092 [Allocatelliglobosispora scoriae]|uniref:ParA family protein n=1 Tax=Allocatelliglobosispora scoriae TaxID=643052 RepID=A0A841BXQ3_9ACTN|nr:SCO2523 family variant P-loop protein [Allocatelliglobosispora scoriae]MBB5871713.1 hypothetical protein [Allocatelliglobosispora scoriae]
MLVFATSDKGGTGRSVTSSNLAYRRSLLGGNVVYLDFDFGSPTAGTIFNIDEVMRGTRNGGLHSYLRGVAGQPLRLDVWSTSDRSSLRGRPDGAGQLVLLPGDIGGAEFSSNDEVIRRCVQLLLRVDEEFDLCIVDLSAGRSYATDVVIAATARPEMRGVDARWLVYHRWTRQHIIAAHGLVFGDRGLVDQGVAMGHDRQKLIDSIRFVRTAVVDPDSETLAGLRPEQVAWLEVCNRDLQRLAASVQIGRMNTVGIIPLDPVLQWREQLITDADTVTRQIANQATVEAFVSLAKRLEDDAAWIGL